MKLLTASLCSIAVALALTGCDQKPKSAGTGKSDSGASSTDHGASTTTPAPAPAPKVEATQATAEGTLTLFFDQLRAGDFAAAAEYVDPTSPGAKQLSDGADALETARANPNLPSDLMDQVLKAFTLPYADVQTKKLVEEGDRARFEVRLNEFPDPQVLDLQKTGDKWLILLPEGFIKAKFGGLPGGAAQPAAPAAQPATPPAEPATPPSEPAPAPGH